MKPPNVEGLGLRIVTNDTGLIPPTPTSSVELHRNAQGKYSWTIKAYQDDHLEAIAEIKGADDRLRRIYLEGEDA